MRRRSGADTTATRWATFDCYGTLIDWNGGIRRELARVFGEDAADAKLHRYHELEPVIEQDGSLSYAEVLTEALARSEFRGEEPLEYAAALLARGERSTFHDENARMARALAIDDAALADARLPLLFDPQTAGGLLLAITAEHAPQLEAELREQVGEDVATVLRLGLEIYAAEGL